MQDNRVLDYIKNVLHEMPTDWLNLTTHRLDIYNEPLAKTQFLEKFEYLFLANNFSGAALKQLPTAYDYIRLGHPLSCLLEWAIAKSNNVKANNVISFSSHAMPVLAVLRKNLLAKKNTQILYSDKLPSSFNADLFKRIYGYKFEIGQIESAEDVAAFDGSTIFLSNQEKVAIDRKSVV